MIKDIDEIFWNHIHKYDANEPSILRKIVHSYSVANASFDIACYLKLSEKERRFCYIMGLFHDIGRFEQWKLYKTFDDNKCGSHGDIGVEMFNKYIDPTTLGLDKEETELLLDTISYHINPYNGNDEKLWKFINIIRSADAYANVRSCALGNQELDGLTDGYLQEFLDKYINQQPLFNISVTTKVERLLKSVMAVNYVKFDFLRENIIKKDIIELFYDTYKNVLTDEDKIAYRKGIDYLKSVYTAKVD